MSWTSKFYANTSWKRGVVQTTLPWNIPPALWEGMMELESRKGLFRNCQSWGIEKSIMDLEPKEWDLSSTPDI